jgi:hypothetical protein
MNKALQQVIFSKEGPGPVKEFGNSLRVVRERMHSFKGRHLLASIRRSISQTMQSSFLVNP